MGESLILRGSDDDDVTGVVLYKQGPPFYHAAYSVVVKQVDCDFSPSSSSAAADVSASWTSLAALNRITQQVAKVT